jgi:2-aminoadipate transaminase
MVNPQTDTLPGLALSSKSLRTKEQPISFLIAEALRNPRLINLAAGLVDPLTLPVEECEAITRRIFTDVARGRAALQYDTTLGLGDLRRRLLTHIEELEGKSASAMSLTENDIVCTTGSQQALYLIGDALIDPGDIVIAANPSYFVYAGALQSLGATVFTVPMDANGMVVDEVQHLLARLEREGRLDRVKLVYCTSYFQNPTGLTLSAERRPRLLEIVQRFSKRHRILILEDAAYRELRYDGESFPSIKSYDPHNQFTIISHTFSKPFAPGIKLGYTAAPPELLNAMLNQKGNHDFGSANLTQHIALETMHDGSYAKHVKVLCDAYRAKRDAMVDALKQHMPADSNISWTYPHGGLYVWIALPAGFDTSRGSSFFNTCVDRGVLYVPGVYCFQPDEHGMLPTNHIRLSFGQVAPDQIASGIERLASVVRDHLPSNPQSELRSPQSAGVAG